MTATEMSRFVEVFFLRSNELQWKKNKDYHPDDVAFLEILRTAHECGMTVEQDLWAKIRKQYVALRGFVLEGTTESEPPVSRMMDIAVYMGMFAYWINYKHEILYGAVEFVTGMPCTNVGDQGVHNGEDPCDRCQFLGWLIVQCNAL